jgi:hypothetical protein
MQKMSKLISMDNQRFFWHDYFLHMWPTPRTKNCEVVSINN